jgi:hypothetical protein
MVGITRIARIVGDPRAALAFSVEITNFLKQKYTDTAQCWARIGGPGGQIVWQIALPDMAAIEKFNEQLLADEEYWGKVEKARLEGLFDTASFEDGLWNQLA